MRLEKYNEYKASEIFTIENIPLRWKVNRIKAVGDIRYGLGQPPRELENGLPIIRATNVFAGRISSEKLIYVDPDDLPYDRKPILKENDIIVVRSGAYTGDSSIIPKKYAGAVSGYDLVLCPSSKLVYPKYIAYTLLSNYVYKDQLVLTSLRAAQPHLNKEELGSTLITLPSKHEQTQIANYLDRKTTAIDKKIALLEQKSKYYQELRKSLINETVCRGLDKSAKLKDSGIGWIGKIPEHWEVKRLKSIVSDMGSGGTPTSSVQAYYENGMYNWLNTGDLNDGYIFNTHKKISKEAIKAYPNLKTYKEGTLIFAMYGATIGKLGFLKIEATTNQACCCLNFSKNILSKYIFYWFLCNKQNIISLSVGGTQPNVSQGILSQIKINLPPYKEQLKISQQLDTQTSKIDQITTNIKSQVESLKELRLTLINDVVTGKIRVCEVHDNEAIN